MGMNKYAILAIVAVVCLASVFLVSTATNEGPFASEQTVHDSAPSPQIAQPTVHNPPAPMPSYAGGCGV